MKIYVAGYKGAGFGGGFIKRFTFSEFSHVTVVFDMQEQGLEYEAIQGKRFHKQRFNVEDKSARLFCAEVNEDQITAMMNAAESILGSRYDWTGIWGFMVRKKREKMNWWFCSEVTPWILSHGQLVLQRKEFFKHTPGDVCCSVAIEPCETPKKWV